MLRLDLKHANYGASLAELLLELFVYLSLDFADIRFGEAESFCGAFKLNVFSANPVLIVIHSQIVGFYLSGKMRSFLSFGRVHYKFLFSLPTYNRYRQTCKKVAKKIELQPIDII